MPTSDSEDFESADEGGAIEGVQDNKSRKKCSPSLAKESDNETKKSAVVPLDMAQKIIDTEAEECYVFKPDGEQPIVPTQLKPMPPKKERPLVLKKVSTSEIEKYFGSQKSKKEPQDEGWDDFDDWDETETSTNTQNKAPSEDIIVPVIQPVKTWDWGNWGVDSLLSSATAGISSLTTQVSQGLSTVLETGIGAPDPAELARKNADLQRQAVSDDTETKSGASDRSETREEVRTNEGEATFQFGSLISGVTKFVETTGTKVLAGGLDTLETIGKKTMEVLQDGDPGLVKKRAMFGLDAGETVVLSQVLREAKAKAEEEDHAREERREAKEVHYETLFDDFEGLVHLEALEMLSNQVKMRIEERLRSADADKRQEIKETLQQVAELCEMPDDEEDEEECPTDASSGEAFLDRLQAATQDLGLKLQFSALVKLYTDTVTSLDTAPPVGKSVYKLSVTSLAHYSALATEIYHKSSEMLLVKTRRATADEADALALMTAVLTKHIGVLANAFSDKLNSLPDENKDQINTYITNVFLEASNSSTYIQNAFQLTLPILQIGAV